MDKTSCVCWSCIEDEELSAIIKSEGNTATCCLCRKRRRALSLTELAVVIDPVIREYFRHGSYRRRYGPGDDDSYDEVQEGDDLSWVLQEVLGQYLDCEDALIEALVDGDPDDRRGGEEPFFDQTVNYKARRVIPHSQYTQWNAIKQELAYYRRFFSFSAKEFFDWPFEELEDLSAPPNADLLAGFQADGPEQTQSVVRELAEGTKLFRGRTCIQTRACTLF